MRGNMFFTNKMQIIFIICYNLNVFQATFRMSFRKTDVLPPGYIMLKKIIVLIISTEQVEYAQPANKVP